MNEIESWLRLVLGLGLEGKDINFLQMALRAVVVYLVTVLIVRLGKKRFMGRATAFDVILGIMLGSIVSRGVTGNAPFFGALAASTVLLLMHWLFSDIALHWHGFGWLVKGRSVVLVRDGAVDEKVLRKVHVTEKDLWEDLRTKGISDLKQVAEARLERSGQLSVIKAKQEPKVVEVSVAEGVQKVRVEIGG
ncbi:DUF421 domain-containing protein [Microvirga aerilata]|uniref:DUF421 domain-containing protein n=1 Tax=Microvirga aerilata TaxID=670292 RepID=A0A936ZD55_9HYPH|nr:YetF domain-containing protein [Microvirga aerilata]MBL0407651.1 DUF421 domain-containing protein [Microvirga aerilata]